MRLVKLGTHWVNPEAVFYVWECEVGAPPRTLISSTAPGLDLVVPLPLADVVAALTQPEAPTTAGVPVAPRRALAGWGDDA